MIQDIDGKFDNTYYDLKPDGESFVLSFRRTEGLFRVENGRVYIPRFKELSQKDKNSFRYLFSVCGEKYFLSENEIEPFGSFKYEKTAVLRSVFEKHTCFAAETAYHLYCWYNKNKFCGVCGKKLSHRQNERAIFCRSCSNVIYPSIAPAIIVGVTNGDSLLLTKYAGRLYKRYSLVAGFCEIGETAEDTVRREVMEEVGLRVKNIRYYKSQPWGFDSNMLFGFFAQLDGETKISIDNTELSQAQWIKRNDMAAIEDDGISLTREMMRIFKDNQTGIF